MDKAQTGFTCEEICKIITTAGQSGVSLLQWSDFRVEFKGTTSKSESVPPSEQPPSPPWTPAKDIEAREVAVREREVAELLLQNPLEYERLLALGEIPLESTVNGTEET